MTLKEITEKRNEHRAIMTAILEAAEGENRAINEEEQGKFAAAESAIHDLDATASAIRAAQAADLDDETRRGEADGEEGEQRAESAGRERDPIGALLRGGEQRAVEEGMTTSSLGPIIPSEFSGDIVRDVRERSAIFGDITIVQSRGIYKQIAAENMVQGAWLGDELEEFDVTKATYTTKEISHYTCGALAIMSNESINQTEFNVTADVVDQINDTFLDKLETGIFMGNGTKKPTGLISGGTPFALAAANTITADELVKIKYAIKATYAANASWRMSRKTLESISLLKDAEGRFIFSDGGLKDDFAGTILGKIVKISEFVPNYTIFYGDFKRAYKANLGPDITVQILKERFAELNATGVLGVMYVDGKTVKDEAYAVAKHTPA
jgi:HK97 family phage major capsid protein